MWKKLVEFDIKLPDFYESRIVIVKAYVDEDAVGNHDIIFGWRFCSELGLILDYKNKVTWNNLSIPMMDKSSSHTVTELSYDPMDRELPSFMKKATHRMTKGLSANRYDKHNYRDMVKRCNHLTSEMKSSLLQLFSKYVELFSGRSGACRALLSN